MNTDYYIPLQQAKVPMKKKENTMDTGPYQLDDKSTKAFITNFTYDSPDFK